jgi:predicted nucleotidyltransferase
MPSLTEKEKKALLILLKDINTFYNANSLSKVLAITRIGTQKMLKRLEKENILISREIGKSITYRPQLENDYAKSLFSFLLADEANNFQRWKKEFNNISKENRVIVLFGSVLKDYKNTRDIDILILFEKEEYDIIKESLDERRKVLPKTLHSLIMTEEDFLENVKSRKGEILEIVRIGVILSGHNKYVELMAGANKGILSYWN